MDAFVDGDLRIDVCTLDRTLVLSWRGKATLEDADRLRIFVERVADEASRRTSWVELRLDAPEQLDSATVTALIRAMRRLREQNTGTRVSYASSTLLKRTFEVLRVLEREGVLEFREE